MSATLKIVDPGLHTTIQDRGRLGFQSAGVPVSGALDGDSLVIANALVGNAPDEAALEIRYSGPTILINADRALIALTAFEILVAGLQAFIFTILTAVYIGGAAHPEH